MRRIWQTPHPNAVWVCVMCIKRRENTQRPIAQWWKCDYKSHLNWVLLTHSPSKKNKLFLLHLLLSRLWSLHSFKIIEICFQTLKTSECRGECERAWKEEKEFFFFFCFSYSSSAISRTFQDVLKIIAYNMK